MKTCRSCKNPLSVNFIDLAFAPPSNAFLSRNQLNQPEVYFPLNVQVCTSCWLVQIEEFESAQKIFNSEYVYFSSYSKSWLEHCERYSKKMIDRLTLNQKSSVVEIASNDGYLLQYFKDSAIPVLGIEPTASTAQAAQKKGIDTWVRFFNTETAVKLAKEKQRATLLIANNVLAHVPNLLDFLAGVKIALAEDGVFTAEFPHLLSLVSQNQFDTIYHEHFSYFSLLSLQAALNSQGLRVFDVEEIPTHGGSLRVYVDHGTNSIRTVEPSVGLLLNKERAAGMETQEYYQGFQARADHLKYTFLTFALQARAKGKKLAGYGAAAKGNTFLNYCGFKSDLIPYVVDASPHKQGKFLPGSHIPVVAESVLKSERPDYVVVFPWNLKNEIVSQLSYIREWGGQFVTMIPNLTID